ncbi:hypothetical protein EXIGLDRAFT_822203 [Exidia glandulosa HHB12029]|uniref:F-box domain-containing protein n=1 Tax=Exidia glandulosa HHB12029 TaxID=1314781 RepID=A0A166N985_EXIGL|nr:hypothetical protein EXIGLDRAFT_822203 [Exidia glandulosa HHB12029]
MFMSHPRRTVGIDGLPLEILLEVAELTSLQDRVRLAQVSRIFRTIGLTPHLWGDLRSWPAMRPSTMAHLVARALPSPVPLRLRVECTRNEDVILYAAVLCFAMPRIKDLYLAMRCNWNEQMAYALQQSAPLLESAHIQSAADVEFGFPIFRGVAPMLQTLWLDAIRFRVHQPVLDTVRNFGTADFPVIAGSTPGQAIEMLYLIDFESTTSPRPLFNLLTYAHLTNLRHLYVEFETDINSSISSALAGHLIPSCPHLQSMGFTNAPGDLSRFFLEALPTCTTVLFDSIDSGTQLQILATTGTVFTLTHCDIIIDYLIDNSRVTDNVHEIVLGRSTLVHWSGPEVADFVDSVAELRTLSLVIGVPPETFPEVSNLLDPECWDEQRLYVPDVRELRITAPESFTVSASAIEGFVQNVLQHPDKLTTRSYYGFDIQYEDGQIHPAANPHYRWAHESRLPKLTRYLWSLRHNGYLDLDADRIFGFPTL